MSRYGAHPVGVPFAYLERRERQGFQCADCKAYFTVLAYGRQPHRADGLMVCGDCAERHPDLAWRCSRCGRLYPVGRNKVRSWCTACDRPTYVPVTPTTRPCERCGQPFTPKRSDARYCSTRCRVAAHRAR